MGLTANKNRDVLFLAPDLTRLKSAYEALKPEHSTQQCAIATMSNLNSDLCCDKLGLWSRHYSLFEPDLIFNKH